MINLTDQLSFLAILILMPCSEYESCHVKSVKFSLHFFLFRSSNSLLGPPRFSGTNPHATDLTSRFQVFRFGEVDFCPVKGVPGWNNRILNPWSANGIFANPYKVKAIRKWPKPMTITEARSSHGFASFYWRFVRHFSSIMTPIID